MMRSRLLFCLTMMLMLTASHAVFAAGLRGEGAETFADAPAGPFTELEREGATWTASEGSAAIHRDTRHGGEHTLRLLGGEDRTITLSLDKPTVKDEMLSFLAERWTSRAPFSFRVERRHGNGWEEVYNGDEAVKVGGYHTHVRIALPAGTRQVRMTGTTHAEGGVLIKDVRLREPQPMRVVETVAMPVALPALVNKPRNAVAAVRIDVVGAKNPIAVTRVLADLEGTTDLSDVSEVELFHERNAVVNREGYAIPRELSDRLGEAQGAASELTFRGEQVLSEGANYFWLCATLDEGADLTHRVGGMLKAVQLSDGTTLTAEDRGPSVQRLGVSLRDGGDDGSSAYRIPGLATTNEGTLIAVYDIRWRGWGDLPGDIDVGMSRSTDGGSTWGPMQTIMDYPADEPNTRGNGVGDPSVLVDDATNTIWVAGLWSHGNRGWAGSGPGLEPDETGQFVLVKSEDDGKTWSDHINVTAQMKNPEWRLFFNGPGKGITMRDGTLVFPAQFKDANNLPHSTIIYSKDHGETWEVGTGARSDTTEAQVVELNDGTLMLNMRDNRGGSRAVAVTHDLGETWEAHSSSRSTLPEPVCMASIIRVDEQMGSRMDGLLFSNPAVSSAPRRMMTIKYSPDGGSSWPRYQQVLLDAGQSAGYSCLTMIDSEHVGILYESSRAHLVYQVVPLREIVEKTAQSELFMEIERVSHSGGLDNLASN